MERNFKEALKHRRSYYHISNNSPISDKEIKEIIDFAVLHIPSAFNSQSTRVVLLLGENHKRLWEITKDTLRKIVAEEAFEQTEIKINNSLVAGHGTILFFEDMAVIENLQQSFPTYHEKFPLWAQQTSAMHQLAIWTMLEDAGLGVSLQHYNPLIDKEVAEEWNINPHWELIAQMPFGTPTEEPGEKEIEPLDKRVLIFK